MSKKLINKPVDLEKTIMAKVASNEISMKPRWFFVAGSVFSVAGLVAFSIAAVFLTNLTVFLLRKHGPMGEWRLQMMLESFPWWIPVLAIGGIMAGIWLLKKYDFSYKKNFWLIIAGFIVSVLIAAFIIDRLGLNDMWRRQGPMRRFYQQIEGDGFQYPGRQGGMRNGQDNRLNK